MVARLGQVLYWSGCVLAALIAGGSAIYAITGAYDETGWTRLGIFGVGVAVAAVPWAVGRACLYVLAGR